MRYTGEAQNNMAWRPKRGCAAPGSAPPQPASLNPAPLPSIGMAGEGGVYRKQRAHRYQRRLSSQRRTSGSSPRTISNNCSRRQCHVTVQTQAVAKFWSGQ